MRQLSCLVSRPTVRALLLGAAGVAGVSAAIGVLDNFASAIGLTGLYLFAVLPVALVAGFWAAVAVAVASALTFGFFFARPYGSFYIANSGVAVALVVSVAAALLVSTLARRAQDRAEEARQRAQEAERAREEQSRLAAEVRASRARIVTTADDTRWRIERDLHDGAQQRLVHTVVTLRLARREIPDDTPAADLVDEALEQALTATELLRELVHGILPATLNRGLQPAIEGLVSRLPVRVSVDLPEQRLPQPVERTVYFVVAEALTNVVKHAGASTAEVRGSVADGAFRVKIRDDGRGGARVDGHSGLLGLEDRVAALDGELTLDSPIGSGTVVAVQLPLGAPEGY